jgi:plasmid stabilization system protein ParE
MKQHDLLSDRRARPHSAGFGEVLWALLLAAEIVMAVASGTATAAEAPDMPTPRSEIEDQLGIKIVGLRRSSAGYMLDFRYRLLDPAKAASLLDRKIRPYLLDEATGAQLGVPDAPKVGQLRPTSRNNVIPGRNYYILFANPGRYLKAGSKVTLIAGDTRISQLTVE